MTDLETDDTGLMERLTAPLWQTRSVSLGVSPPDVSNIDALKNNNIAERSGVTIENGYMPKMYAITINIKPTKYMNNKQWRNYDHDNQIKILERIEQRFIRDHPSIKRVKLVFEECPTLKNMHFHALYEMVPLFVCEMEAYYDRICNGDNIETRNKWRFMDSQEIYDMQGWLTYITKTLKPVKKV